MMKKSTNYKGLALIVSLIFIAAFTRLIPHAPNFTAVGATAIFGAAMFKRKWFAFLVPVLALWLSDLVLNNFVYTSESFSWFHSYQLYTIGAMLLVVFVASFILKHIKASTVLMASIASALLFFLVSNFGAWVSPGALFPKTFIGLVDTYIAGLPFLRNDFAATLFFSGVLFGAHYLITTTFPSFKLAKVITK